MNFRILLETSHKVLQLMLTTIVLESVVSQTKLFAEQKGVDFPFCIEELLAFIGINIAMGLLKLTELRDYWSQVEILSTPWFPAVMSRDRFQLIFRYLHINDSSNQKDSGDPLYKVRPLVDHLSAVFPIYLKPAQQLSVDEVMIGTRCRVAFLQYLPKNQPNLE